MLLKPFLSNAQTAPERVAAIDDTGSYTNAALVKMAFGIGAMLKAKTQKKTVGVLLPAGAAFVASFYGTLLAGKVVVPINFLLGPREVGHIIKDSGIDTILSAPPLAAKLAGLPVNVIDLSLLAGQVPEGAATLVPPQQQASDLATILYTSGTSGLPKGVCLTHGNLHEDVHACIPHARLTGEHTFLGIVPLFHSTGLLATMLAPITLGAKVVYIARFSPAATLAALRTHKISVMAAVPSMYGAIIRLKDATPADWQSMYAPLSGGEPLPANIREAFLARFGLPICEGYGLSETIGPISFNVPGRVKAGSVGEPIPGAEFKIVDDNNNSLPPNQTGEVLIKGPMIMKGYHNLPEETAKAIMPDGFFRTGDLGHLDEEGYLFITGRKKDLIIVSGEKVYPREIEELLVTHPAVAEAAVIGQPCDSRGEKVVAFIVPRDGETVTPDALRTFCRDQSMINWKIPKEVYVVPDLPRSPTGKVLKRELKVPAQTV
ncbi:MAG TPA: AMP-binding protein [Tepidisphaeraceae bacterium]